MIANALRLDIEKYAAKMPTSNPLFRKAEDGSFTSTSMVSYLANVRHLSCEAQLYLSQAGRLASERGDELLARHYAHKRHEELGHEVWADRDIARITAKSTAPVAHDVLPSIHGLIAFLGRVVDEDPSLYLAYTLFAEYLIVLLGTEWLLLLEERCGIPRSSMTIIGNHIELDREHVEEAFDEIDALVGDPSKLPRMREVLAETLAHFDRFCAEVTADSSDLAWHPLNANQHVSAA
jgi:hypothetical protein